MTEPVERLEEITLDGSRLDKTTRIDTLASPTVRLAFTTFLKANQDVFAWSHEDMLGIDPSIMVHRLNVSPSFPPIQRKKQVFTQEWDQAIEEKVGKLQEAGLIREVYYPRLVGKRSNGQESQRKMKDVRRLHGPEQGMPQG